MLIVSLKPDSTNTKGLLVYLGELIIYCTCTQNEGLVNKS